MIMMSKKYTVDLLKTIFVANLKKKKYLVT